MIAPRMIFGLSVILLANAAALVGVASNRAGAPLQTVEFSQDELDIIPGAKDDSSVRLRLEWSRPGDAEGTYLGFDEAQLRELGFDLPPIADASGNVSPPPPRELYVALRIRTPDEMPAGGPEAGRKAPDGAPAGFPRAPRRTASRLVVLDAAQSYEQLRGRLPDPQRNPILRAVVSARPIYGPRQRDPAWQGHVFTLIPSSIHVPLPFSARLAPLKQAGPQQRRYRVTLHYGRELEPWVAGVEIP